MMNQNAIIYEEYLKIKILFLGERFHTNDSQQNFFEIEVETEKSQACNIVS